MVGASKILTVSYGTFSCTLEGFDDPFSTMKSIAEYFRDLAADDRYFGAEPPTPDAEMLSRIAEKEIQRRVEARIQDNGIVLKQLGAGNEMQPSAPMAAHVTAPMAAPVAAAAAATAPVAYAQPSDEPEFEPEYAADAFPAMADLAEVPAAGDAAQAETVAEKLSRIRAVVSAARANAAAEAEPVATFADADLVSEEIAGEDAAFEDDATELEIAEALAAFDGEMEEIVEEMAEAVEDEASDEVWTGESVEDSVAEDEAMSDAADVAAETDVAEGDIVEDTVAEEGVAKVEEDEVVVAWASDEAEDAEVASVADETEVEAEVTTFVDEDAEEDEGDAWDDESAASDAVAEAEDEDEPYARVVKLTRPEVEQEVGSDTAYAAWSAEDEVSDEDEVRAEDRVAAEDEAEAEDDWASFDDEDEDDDDLRYDEVEDRKDEAALAVPAAVDQAFDDEDMDEDRDDEFDEDDDARQGIAADIDDDPIAAEIRATLGAQLSARHEDESGFEDEADDKGDKAVAEDTREAARKWSWDDEDEDDDEAFDEDAAAEAGAMAARERLQPLSEPEGDAADVDRLLEKTNSQMAETEGTRRRSAIAHLKAAVAATKADRLLKRVSWREKTDAEVQTQYRDDLAQVVRPRRPSETAAEAPRERPKPIGEAKSPLMLVSELRVDADTARVLTPIRPRRIQSDEEAEAALDMDGSSYEDAAGFAAFAEKMGAKDLTDLLEAAAAYAAFVENRPHFSRPQLMKRVARYEAGGDFTREAGLRSFGQLLRQGKIRKLKRGQFTVADTTRFNPEARIAGE